MLKTCWILAAAWLWLCAGGAPATAANGHFSVQTWDTEEGLPENTVIAITQTRDGYLWLGTLDGLARFDGTRFTVFNEGNTPGLDSNRILKLFEDSQGRLWIGTETAGVFLAKDGKVRGLGFGRGSREGRLVSVCEDVSGAVWLYAADGRLGRYYQGKLEQWQVGEASASQWRSMITDNSGRLWIGAGLRNARFPLGMGFKLGAFQPGSGMKPGELPPEVYTMEEPMLDFGLLLPSRQGGYWRLANGRIQKWKANHLVRDFGAYPWNRWKAPVNAACEDRQGNLIVGTGGEGLFWFDAQGNHVQLTNSANGLSYNTVLSLCVDREGDLWVGTDGHGLNRVKPQVFQVLDGTQHGTVQSVCEDPEGGLWIGYFGERIDHWSHGVLEHVIEPEVPGSDRFAVKSVFVARDGTVWAGTYRGGLLQLAEGRFRLAPGAQVLRPDQEVSAFFQDHDNRLWAGTQAGLAQWDGQTWSLMTNGLPSNTVRAIAEQRDGSLWVGTEGSGLWRRRDGQLTVFTKTNGLPSDNVLSLYCDRQGVLWVGTAGGLARFEAGRWTSYTGRRELAGGSIGYLLEDGRGFLWIGCNAGLMRLRKKDLNDIAAGRTNSLVIRSYGKVDGLPTRECSQGSQPAACRARDGTLWFPTTAGLVSVNPALLTRNTNPPPVLIESVLVDGRLQWANSLRSARPEKVTVPASAESLEIHYTSLNLSAPDKGQFKYCLEHYETTWTERPGNVRYVRYSKLPPGNYRFRITACNEDGTWNGVGDSLAIEVLPPFWRTWWFLSASTLCLLGLIIGSVHYASTQRLQRQLAAMRQHEALEKERARIARDLHDQLGANLTQVALLGEMAETDKDLPQEVEGHARQISQTARDTTHALDEIVWTVNPSNDTLDGLINYVCKYAQEYLALAGLRYRMEVPAQLPGVPISPELRHNVFLAAKEAINNVVKHAQASAAWLRLQLEPDRFILEIEDNGRGLAAGDEKKGRNGLRNMRKRMEDIGGRFEAGPGAEGGTKVRLTAPLLVKG